jgi:hypothetical protein
MMKHLIYIIIGLFILCTTATSSFGQKRKNRDAFSGKSKKGPNIYSSKPPRGKSKSKLYGHSISKKKGRKKSKGGFSSTKRKYKSVNSKPSKGDKGAPGSSGGRKSGKGRKKEK